MISRSEEWEASEVEASSAMNVRPGRVAAAPSSSLQRTLNPKLIRHRPLAFLSGWEGLVFRGWQNLGFISCKNSVFLKFEAEFRVYFLQKHSVSEV